MNSIFPITYTIWLISEILLNRLLRSKSEDKQNADKNSLLLIWVTVVLSNTAAYFIAMNFDFHLALNPVVNYLGLAIIYLGMFVRLVAILQLGRFFTVDVTIREDHKLKQDGLYKYLRHPSYFASLLSFIGFGVSLNNWVSLVLVTGAVLTVFIVRIKIEEKILIGQFGEEYLSYMKRTSGIIPFLY